MSEKKPKVPRYTTPAGVAAFVWLNTPDTKFKADGEYTVSLIMDAEAAQPLIETLEAALKEAHDVAVASYMTKLEEAKGPQKAKLKAKGEVNTGDFYTPYYDDDGNETGEVIFKFKMNASFVKKENGEDKVIRMSPQMFDAKGVKLNSPPNVAPGSILKINFSPNPYYVDATHTAGIQLRLNAVQIIELKTFGGGGDAGSYGFQAEEGYESNPENEAGFRDEYATKGADDF